MSNELDIPLVATNDVHYINKEDASTHDLAALYRYQLHRQRRKADENGRRLLSI